MRKFEDFVGKVFGRFTVLRELEPIITFTKYQKAFIRQLECKCSCGTIKIIAKDRLVSGHTLSCGCYNKEVVSKIFTKHGCSYLKATLLQKSTYASWKSMRSRCNNPNNPKYSYYGGRGVTVCNTWNNPTDGFENFVKDVGFKSVMGLTIDRIDSNKNYEPGNCRWITRKEQNNNKRNSRKIEYNGNSYTIEELSKLIGMNKYTLRGRIYDHGWTVDRAINEKVKIRKSSKK